MAIQFSTDVRNARLDAVETTIGASAVLKLRTGAKPANCAAADSGTVLGTLNLPADYLAAAAAGVKSKSGVWSTTGIGGGGTVGHFRLYASDGVTCKAQGTVGQGSGDMSLVNVVVADGQPITIDGFTLTDGNA